MSKPAPETPSVGAHSDSPSVSVNGKITPSYINPLTDEWADLSNVPDDDTRHKEANARAWTLARRAIADDHLSADEHQEFFKLCESLGVSFDDTEEGYQKRKHEVDQKCKEFEGPSNRSTHDTASGGSSMISRASRGLTDMFAEAVLNVANRIRASAEPLARTQGESSGTGKFTSASR